MLVKNSNNKFHKNPSCESLLHINGRPDGRTDGRKDMAKLTVDFCNCVATALSKGKKFIFDNGSIDRKSNSGHRKT
jgi:hypothetical protein